MPRVAGELEFPDGTTPGSAGDGGWSQNVYDEDGRLQTHATFHPGDDDDEDEAEDSELRDAVAKATAATALLVTGWAAHAGWNRLRRWRNDRAAAKPKQTQNDAGTAKAAGGDIEDAPQVVEPIKEHPVGAEVAINPPTMSIDEVRRRLFLALIAQAFADEQFAAITNAHVEGSDDQSLRAAIDSLRSAPLGEVATRLNRALESGSFHADLLGSRSMTELFGGGEFVDGVFVPIPEPRVNEMLGEIESAD